MIITRKLQLIPIISENSAWEKKVNAFIIEDYKRKIKYYEEKLENAKKAEKTKIKEQLNTINIAYEEYLATGNLTKKNIDDYTYNTIRTTCASESQRKNTILSYVYSELMIRQAINLTKKERNELINKLIAPAIRVKGSATGSLWDEIDINIDNPLNAYGNSFSKQLSSHIKDLIEKEHLLEGKCSLTQYKNDAPFTIAAAHLSITSNYPLEELTEDIFNKDDFEIYVNFGGYGNPTIMKFKVNLGPNVKKINKEEIRITLLRLLTGEYTLSGSSLQITGKKIILNLSMNIPEKVKELDESIVVGVDLGIKSTAVCALNNDYYKRLVIGSADDFLRVRTKIRNERRQLQKALKMSSGGHGRNKKLKKLNTYSKYERNWAKTYNHKISSAIINFALENNAKYINLENLKGYNTSQFLLSTWSYYELQTMIEYKAAKYGIIVRYINPYHTSQICSVCHGWHEGDRKSQEIFECSNPECESHIKYKNQKTGREYFNADFNAARNISMSEDWLDRKQDSTVKAKREQHIQYLLNKYGINIYELDPKYVA